MAKTDEMESLTAQLAEAQAQKADVERVYRDLLERIRDDQVETARKLIEMTDSRDTLTVEVKLAEARLARREEGGEA